MSTNGQNVGTTFEGAHNFHIHGNTIINKHYEIHSLETLMEFVSFSALHESSAQDPECVCHPGTRERVLTQIRNWTDDPNTPERILWLHGPVGVGKSAIAQTISNSYSRDEIGASFFFVRSDSHRNDGNRLFPTLAWQLALSVPIVKDLISSSLEEDPNLPRKTVEAQFDRLIVQPFLLMSSSESEPLTRVIVIDGFDECYDVRLQRRILQIIGNAVAEPRFPLRFLISSRTEAYIEDFFSQFQYPTLQIDLANADDASRDIETYFTSEFVRTAGEQGLDPSLWPGQQKMQRLVSKSVGQFSYAASVVKFVGDEYESAVTQLDIILGMKPLHGRPPFSGLDQSYLEILERQPDQDFLKTFLVLLVGRCSISRDDSPSDEDAMLMDISRVDLGRKLRQMHSILKLEPYIGVHYPSFLEFLQDPLRSGQYYVSMSAATRRKLESITKILIRHAARLTKQPDFHGTDHFSPTFGKLINGNSQAIELNIEDWEQILRPLLDVLNKLLVPSNIYSLKAGYCQQCRFFHVTFDIVTYFKSLRDREDSDVEKCLKSLEEIIRYGDPDRGQQNFDLNFGRYLFGSAAIVGTMMAILAHQR